jgi:hypothetical protein
MIFKAIYFGEDERPNQYCKYSLDNKVLNDSIVRVPEHVLA